MAIGYKFSTIIYWKYELCRLCHTFPTGLAAECEFSLKVDLLQVSLAEKTGEGKKVPSPIFAARETCSKSILKAQGHVTVNKPVISIIYIVSHTWPLCSVQILVDGVNPLESYFQKSTNISVIVQHMSVSFVSLQSSRAHLQNSTVI